MGLLVRLRKRLYERGHFRYDASTAKTRELWNANANPIEMFQMMHVRRAAPDDLVPLSDLYDTYQAFCADRGIAALTQRGFNKHIAENYEKFSTTMDGKSVRAWIGMRILQQVQTTLKDVDDAE